MLMSKWNSTLSGAGFIVLFFVCFVAAAATLPHGTRLASRNPLIQYNYDAPFNYEHNALEQSGRRENVSLRETKLKTFFASSTEIVLIKGIYLDLVLLEQVCRFFLAKIKKGVKLKIFLYFLGVILECLIIVKNHLEKLLLI